MMHPATIMFVRQLARLVKGVGTALDEWAKAMEQTNKERGEIKH